MERRFTPIEKKGALLPHGQRGAPSKGRSQQGVWPLCTRLVRLQKAPTRPWTSNYSPRGVCLRVVQVLLRQSKEVHLDPEPGKDIPTGGGKRSTAVWPLPLLVRKGSGPEACSQAPHGRASFPTDAWPQNTHSSDTTHTHTHTPAWPLLPAGRLSSAFINFLRLPCAPAVVWVGRLQ